MRHCWMGLLALSATWAFAEPASEPPSAADPAAKHVRATALEGPPPRLDAVLDEPCWGQADWLRGLTQKDPVEGPPAAELTEVAFVYDENCLYIGARLSTALTGRIHGRMGPRDDMGQTQAVFFSLDTYHDKRTAYTFGVTATGVQVDFHHPHDEELYQVLAWDPVWEARTSIHDDHWIVEARIPFSQLRFHAGEEIVFGLQIDRWCPERDSEDYWCMVPRSETGWSSRFGELTGIRGVRPSRRVELLPYIAGDFRLLHDVADDDPFTDGHEYSQRVGGDLKMGLGPNLTLDATINPDFGQVEADPAEVNLTAFETYFEERRPFFLEGDRLLRGNGPRYYYSRRIGAQPWLSMVYQGIEGTEMPEATRILGATKLSGRLSGGLSVAALAALTDEEHGAYYDWMESRIQRLRVQPRAGWEVLRLQQEILGNGSTIGLSATRVDRDLKDDWRMKGLLSESATAGGVDWYLRHPDGLHSLDGHWGFSRVTGDEDAIARLQRSPAHYFQRPDADHVHYDPGRESLTGWSGALSLNREGGRHWRWSLHGAAESPGFEINDVGQLSSADDIVSGLDLTYEENQGQGLFRRYTLWNNLGADWNFGGLATRRVMEGGFWGQLPNYWTVEAGYEHGMSAYSDDKTRGGPAMGVAGYNFLRLETHSPELLRPNSVAGGVNTTWGEDRHLALGAWVFARFRPGARLEIRLNPQWNRQWNPKQYLGTFYSGIDNLDHDVYLFSRLDYREVRLATRCRYTLTPRLKLEWYAEPFVASLRYSDPGRPGQDTRSQHIHRYADEGAFSRGDEGEWLLTEEGAVLELDPDNSQYASWRSTFVLRWDWRMGSSLYLVWQQDRENYIEQADPDRTPDPFASLGKGGDNRIALKMSAWIPWS